MIDQTLPLFVERLQKVLVIREQRWNTDVKRRRYAAGGRRDAGRLPRGLWALPGGKTVRHLRRWIGVSHIHFKPRGITIAASTASTARRRMLINNDAVRTLPGDPYASQAEGDRCQ